MAKFQKVGSGVVKYGNRLINLKAYKEIANVGIALEDYQPSGIRFTPLQPSKENYENNVEGSFYYSYSIEESEDLEQDFAIIQEALSE